MFVRVWIRLGNCTDMESRDPEATVGCGRKLWGSGFVLPALESKGWCLAVSGRGSGSFEGNKQLPEGNDHP